VSCLEARRVPLQARRAARRSHLVRRPAPRPRSVPSRAVRFRAMHFVSPLPLALVDRGGTSRTVKPRTAASASACQLGERAACQLGDRCAVMSSVGPASRKRRAVKLVVLGEQFADGRPGVAVTASVVM